MSDLIYKILSSSAWTDAQAAGVFVGAEVDLADGFIHFSTAEQVVETARKHFAGQRDLVLVAVAVSALGEKLRFEPSRGGALFPHLYAPLAVELAQWTKPLPIGPDGGFAFPELA